MTLRVYDTYRAKKVDFKPVSDKKVGMYFCGMTVQDKPHMGHMLAFVSGDMIRRYLEYKGYEVTYIQNFTDIDDKIIDKANNEGVEYREVAERNIKGYFEAAEALNLKPATFYPRATQHIKEIVNLIRRLIDSEFAYAAGGDVYFRVRRFKKYGQLSKRRIDDLMSGARIEVGEAKEDPLDFALWKGAKEGEPGWDTPWGRGRPGWHIECSAMSMKYLGATLDFHGGGEDLIFPHHENELAQSEAATGDSFVHFWLHNGLLNLKGEKMSKSTGHFFAMEDVLREFDGPVVRFYLLSTHFRSQMEYSRERLEEAKAGYERLSIACQNISGSLDRIEGDGISSPAGNALKESVAKAHKDFFAAMNDDFNSAGAIGSIFELIRTYNRLVDDKGPALTQDREALHAVRDAIVEFDTVLGLLPEGFPSASGAEVPQDILDLVEARQAARKARDFTKADDLRDRIDALGYILEDTPEGPRVRRK